MEIKKVNTFQFFLYRNLFTIFICFVTLYVTGKIADMDFLLGFNEWPALGRTSQVAISVFSTFSSFDSRYIIIALVTIICSIILYFLLKKYIDIKNQYLWQLFLMSPGLLIYSNAPTKETLFIYPATIFVILECNFLSNKTKLFSGTTLIKIFLLFIMFNTRGDQVFPYVFLFFLSIFIKNIYIGGISHQLKFKKLIINSFFIAVFTLFILSNVNPDYFQRILGYLSKAFEDKTNIIRPVISLAYIKNPINFIPMQYLSLFPTPVELFQKPYKFIIIIDSLLLVYCFKNSWEKLFKTISLSKNFKKIISILFTYVSVVYFVIYGTIGSFNLGSSQRLRLNYLPLGIIFPLILEKKLRDKQNIKYSQS